eukprot:1150961-Pelagomonas_calceolata.AAC.20
MATRARASMRIRQTQSHQGLTTDVPHDPPPQQQAYQLNCHITPDSFLPSESSAARYERG